MLSYLHALILSIVEGLTEFIPVSSTGHMILVSSWLGIHDDAIETFEIFIQLGAILSVVFVFPRRFLALIPGKSSDTDSEFEGMQGMMRFAAACLPVFIIGFLFHKKIKALLFNPVTVACALIAGGLLMIVIERRKRPPEITSLNRILAATEFFNWTFSVSRALAWNVAFGGDIIGGMLLGLERRIAAEFSFLVAVPVMAVAVGYDLLKSIKILTISDLPIFAFGFVTAFIISLFAVKFFLILLNRITLEAFGWYRIGLGVLVLLVLSGS